MILTHRRGWSGFRDIPPDIAAKLEQIWQDLQIDLASLSSKSAHIIATEAGHNIHVDGPQLVIDANLKVMPKAKSEDNDGVTAVFTKIDIPAPLM